VDECEEYLEDLDRLTEDCARDDTSAINALETLAGSDPGRFVLAPTLDVSDLLWFGVSA